MARPDVRRPARPVRHRPTPVRRLRTRARRRVLSATAEARPRHRNHYRSAPSSAARLTDRSRVAIITTPTLRTPTSGPMPLANEWSHQAGERHYGGLIARVFASEHPDEVKGIVFVDAL